MIYISSDLRKALIILLHLFLYVTPLCRQPQSAPSKEQKWVKKKETDQNLSAGRIYFP